MNAVSLEGILANKPYLRSYFDGSSSGAETCSFAVARNGERLLIHQGRRLASKYDPGAEADRLIQSIKTRLRPERILLLSGLGNPIVIDRLLALHEGRQICIAVDHRGDLVRFLAQNDSSMQNFLARPGCHLFAPDMLDALWSYLAGLPIEGFRGITMIRHPGSLMDAPIFYRDVEARVQAFLKSGLSDLLTRFEFESLWLRNTLLNMRYLPVRKSHTHPTLLAHWRDAWRNRPALLVGAGPSLRRSLPLIKSLADRCLILACDTALKPLLRAGIRPQGVHILDAQPHTLLHLRGEDLTGICIFADLVVHPHLTEKLKDAKWIFSTTAKYYHDAAGRPIRLQTPGAAAATAWAGEIGALQSGGSVATSAFDLLRFLGASPILLVGTDLAWTWRQLHSVGTHHYEKWMGTQHRTMTLEHTNELLIQRRVRNPVPALSDGFVMGDHALNLYRHWFEESIAGLPDLSVWNLTGDGAVIAGARRPEILDEAHVQREALATLDSSPDHRSPRDVFAEAIPLRESQPPILHAIAAQAEQAMTSLARESGIADFDRLIAEFPDAAALRRKADSYVRRNASRLDAERKERIIRTHGGKELKRLLHWFDGRIG